VKGVLWYQGESNAEEDWQIADHDRLFSLLVTSWRKAFGRDLPFLFVQLPGLQRPHWPAFRESQRRSLDRLPGLGMAGND
jgi:sialate O-acetylesterase